MIREVSHVCDNKIVLPIISYWQVKITKAMDKATFVGQS